MNKIRYKQFGFVFKFCCTVMFLTIIHKVGSMVTEPAVAVLCKAIRTRAYKSPTCIKHISYHDRFLGILIFSVTTQSPTVADQSKNKFINHFFLTKAVWFFHNCFIFFCGVIDPKCFFRPLLKVMCNYVFQEYRLSHT